MPFTTPKFSDSELSDINEKLESAPTEDTVKWIDQTFGNTAAQMSSFGLEDQALFHIYWTVNPVARLMTLDTLRLPTETYSLFDQTKLRYGVDVEFFYPDMGTVTREFFRWPGKPEAPRPGRQQRRQVVVTPPIPGRRVIRFQLGGRGADMDHRSSRLSQHGAERATAPLLESG